MGHERMKKSPTPSKPSREVQAYANKISLAWRSALESILKVGQLLHEAQAKLDPKSWQDLINKELPFERRTAEKLVKIASDKRITNKKHLPYLPPRWTTLHSAPERHKTRTAMA